MFLELRDICKDYMVAGEASHVLKHVNLTVDEGDFLAIMGRSGSGKTTLMNIIGCLDEPTSGNYYFMDRNITARSANELSEIRNKDIGFIFQTFNLLPKLTALENAALPLLYGGVRRQQRNEMALEALRVVGLEDKADHRPDQLSGGQCQRVAIARAIVGKPALLLADEPTGALDKSNGEQVMELFKTLHRNGSTIIMITHDRAIAGNAGKIKYISDGILADEAED